MEKQFTVRLSIRCPTGGLSTSDIETCLKLIEKEVKEQVIKSVLDYEQCNDSICYDSNYEPHPICIEYSIIDKKD